MRKLRFGEVKSFPSVGSWAKAFDCVLPSPGLLENDTQEHQVLTRCKAVCVLRRAVTSVRGCVVGSDNRVASYHCYPCCVRLAQSSEPAPQSHTVRGWETIELSPPLPWPRSMLPRLLKCQRELACFCG